MCDYHLGLVHARKVSGMSYQSDPNNKNTVIAVESFSIQPLIDRYEALTGGGPSNIGVPEEEIDEDTAGHGAGTARHRDTKRRTATKRGAEDSPSAAAGDRVASLEADIAILSTQPDQNADLARKVAELNELVAGMKADLAGKEAHVVQLQDEVRVLREMDFDDSERAVYRGAVWAIGAAVMKIKQKLAGKEEELEQSLEAIRALQDQIAHGGRIALRFQPITSGHLYEIEAAVITATSNEDIMSNVDELLKRLRV
jgi:hypothetical protein